jgi:hypothetical protein
MSNPLVVIVGIVVAILAGFVLLGIVSGIVHFLLQLIVPVLILVGAGYVLHAIFIQKSLGGGRRTLP